MMQSFFKQAPVPTCASPRFLFAMAGFIFGDALGSIKAIRFTPEKGTDEPKVDIMTLLDGTALGKGKAVQAISPASATGLETRDLVSCSDHAIDIHA